jgi:hypothetical protein
MTETPLSAAANADLPADGRVDAAASSPREHVAALLPCVIDVEASGFGRGSYPIEVGFVMPDGRAVCTLVRPPAHWTHWDLAAEHLHGLKRELLQEHGRSVADVARLLNDKLRASDIYSDNWYHDYAWLAVLFEEAEMVPAFRLHHLAELLDPLAASHWDEAVDQVREMLAPQRHRASSDARVIQLALARVRQPAQAEPSKD